MKNNRNSGLDLLRILLTYFICILHVLGQGGILLSAKSFARSYYVLYFLETFSFCAVDGYALISGYVSCATKLNIKRIIDLWFEIFFYSLGITLLLCSFNIGESLTIKELFKCCFPILCNKYWYMTAYFPLFLFMPILNKGLNKINTKDSKYLLASLIVIFSIFSIVIDNYTNNGLHFLWIFVLYIVGYLVNKLKLFRKINNLTLVFIYIACIIISWTPILIIGKSILISYTSPTIVLSGIVILVLFSRIKLNKKIVSCLYPLTPGIYLFQNNSIVWKFLENRFVYLINNNLLFIILIVLALALLIFTIGAIVDSIRIFIFNLFRVDKLSTLLNNFLPSFFSRICDFVYKLIE